ncbi:MAG: hypothetical protein EOP45_14420 [Sphingobacteriaceae bacterium]|nr:MAG: hypothetical protein EOP45_14420 [Sphingobacteriaceae bacterium]
MSSPYPRNFARKAELQHFAKKLTTEVTADEIMAPLTKDQRRQLDRDVHYVCRFKNGLEPNVFSPQEIATMDHILHILDIHFDEARDQLAIGLGLKIHFFGVKYLLPKIMKTLNREDVLLQIPTTAPSVEIAKSRATHL